MTLASVILRDSGRPDGELSILITDDREIRDLNRQYRGIDQPTDVLSFSQTEGEDQPGTGDHDLLGDVVISIERAREQASERGERLEAELKRLLAHGILHLLGYDHETSGKDARAMERLQEKYAGGD